MSHVYKQDRQASLEDVEIHTILSNERRLMVLKFLREATEKELSVRELSRRIAEIETGESPPPNSARQSAYVALHQTHLPKLAEFGVVDYDRQSKTVALAERSEEVWVYMETVPKYGISWSEYYLGTALLGLLLVLAAETGAPLIADAGTSIWALLLFLLIGGGAIYQTIQQDSSILYRLRDNLE